MTIGVLVDIMYLFLHVTSFTRRDRRMINRALDTGSKAVGTTLQRGTALEIHDLTPIQRKKPEPWNYERRPRHQEGLRSSGGVGGLPMCRTPP